MDASNIMTDTPITFDEWIAAINQTIVDIDPVQQGYDVRTDVPHNVLRDAFNDDWQPDLWLFKHMTEYKIGAQYRLDGAGRPWGYTYCDLGELMNQNRIYGKEPLQQLARRVWAWCCGRADDEYAIRAKNLAKERRLMRRHKLHVGQEVRLKTYNGQQAVIDRIFEPRIALDKRLMYELKTFDTGQTVHARMIDLWWPKRERLKVLWWKTRDAIKAKRKAWRAAREKRKWERLRDRAT